MITVTLKASSLRMAKMLAPYPWDADAGAITFSGNKVTVTKDYASRLIAQLSAARDYAAIKRIKAHL